MNKSSSKPQKKLALHTETIRLITEGPSGKNHSLNSVAMPTDPPFCGV